MSSRKKRTAQQEDCAVCIIHSAKSNNENYHLEDPSLAFLRLKKNKTPQKEVFLKPLVVFCDSALLYYNVFLSLHFCCAFMPLYG
jgi:hypothetical protein